MTTRAEVNNEALKDVAAATVPSSSALVQRKCACGGSAGMTGDCEECNDKKLSVQRSAIGGGPSLSSFNSSLLSSATKQFREREGLQTKLNVSEPGDKYELEADRVADSVMRNSDDAASVTGERDEEDLVQTKLVDGITPLVQRQANEEEEEEDEGDEVQRKAEESEGLLTLAQSEEDKAEQLTGELSQAKLSGSPLPAALRQKMEQAFGVDFGQVKIHSDGAANSLSHSLHASAFTTGTHIFFRQGALDYTSTTGRRLLAHELTHVVQQNPLSRVKPVSKGGGIRPPATTAPEAVAAPDPPVQRDVLPEANEELIQRDDPEGESATDQSGRMYIGYLYLFNRKGEEVFSYVVFHSEIPPLKVGIHRASISGDQPGNLVLKAGGKDFNIESIDFDEFKEKRKKSSQMLLAITTESRKLIRGGEAGASDEDKKGKMKPSGEGKTKKKTDEDKTKGVEGGDKEKGVEGGVIGGTGEGQVTGGGGQQGQGGEQTGGEQTGEQTGGEQTGEQTGEETEGEETREKKPGQPPPTGTPPADKQGDVPPEETPAEDTVKQVETPETPEEGQSEEGKAKQKTGDIQVDDGSENGKKGGTGTGTKPGSKYGWLGWLELPQDVIDVLEKIFEALGDSEEFLALSQLLNHLKDFENYGTEMRSWFDDPDKFLRVVIGLEESEAITALETWAMSAPKKRRRKVKSAGKGLTAILRKVMRVLETIRKILNPVFQTRQGFVTAFGAASEILGEIPAFEELMSEVSKPGTPEFQALVDKLATDFASGIQRQLEDARKLFTAKFEKFTEDDLITYEELARAILSAAKKALPAHYRAVYSVAEKLGLVELTADNLVAPLIPEQALSTINGLLKEMFGLLQPIFEGADAVLSEVITESETVLKDELVPLVKEVFMPQRKSASSHLEPSSDLALLNLMRQSRGQPLQMPVRRELETAMGFDFGSIRIHHDLAAQRASHMFQANAFTVGSDIFFGPGQFNPETELGRHLLTHELTHTIQQGNGHDTGVVQRDAKGLSKEIAEKYKEFLTKAKSFRASPKRKAEAAEMRTVVEGLIGKPIATALPKLPTAYVVVRKKGGKISIRRKPSWVFLVPPLRVVTKTGRKVLAFGFYYYDPKAGARKQLRASLGCKKKEEAHHIIPLELRDHNISKLAEKNGFEFNKAKNGVCLSTKIHSGSHDNYTANIRGQLNDLEKQYTVGGKLQWTNDLSTDLDDMLVRNRKNLKARKTKLN
ncbi:MAG TPA: DUF4157 domain-containing protein [Pyrinomonadaceae bacterium]